MKSFFTWFIFLVFIIFSSYYISLKAEKTVEIKELINISVKDENMIFSAVNAKNRDEVIEFSLDKKTEIFVLSTNKTLENEKNKKQVNININRPNKDVVLILSSKDKTIWNINPSEKTNVKLVIYNDRNEVVSSELIYKYKKQIDLEIDINNKKFHNLLRYIEKIIQKNKIDFFYSAEILEENIEIKNIQENPKFSLNYLSAIVPDLDFNFKLLSSNYEFIPFTLQGPINNKNKLTQIKSDVTYSPYKTKVYEITKNGLKIIKLSTKEVLLKPIPILKKLINPRGIAYDDLNDKIHLADKNGKFFIFDALKESWISIRKYIDDFSINSLSYDSSSNIFLSSNWKKNGIFIFDKKGNFVTSYNLENKLRGLKHHYKDSSQIPQLYLVPKGDNIGIILIDKIVQKIWVFNKLNKNAILTYNYLD